LKDIEETLRKKSAKNLIDTLMAIKERVSYYGIYFLHDHMELM